MHPPAAETDFKTRLAYVLGGRKSTPWAQRLGIKGGTIVRMTNEGIPPTYETLVKILRTENVSLSWLLDGKGAPFHVLRTDSDLDTLMALDEELNDPGWKVAWLHGEAFHALVLFQPAVITNNHDTLEYVAISVISGPVGVAVKEKLRAMEMRLATSAAVDDSTLMSLHAGLLGTWHLLGDGVRQGGVVDLARSPQLPKLETRDFRRAAERDPPEYSGMPPVHRVWNLMTAAEREALKIVLAPFLDGIARRVK